MLNVNIGPKLSQIWGIRRKRCDLTLNLMEIYIFKMQACQLSVTISPELTNVESRAVHHSTGKRLENRSHSKS